MSELSISEIRASTLSSLQAPQFLKLKYVPPGRFIARASSARNGRRSVTGVSSSSTDCSRVRVVIGVMSCTLVSGRDKYINFVNPESGEMSDIGHPSNSKRSTSVHSAISGGMLSGKSVSDVSKQSVGYPMTFFLASAIRRCAAAYASSAALMRPVSQAQTMRMLCAGVVHRLCPPKFHRSNVAKTGAWSEGLSQPRTARNTRLECAAPAISGVAQT